MGTKRKVIRVRDEVHALFRRAYGNYEVIGVVTEVCVNQYALKGRWYAIKVTRLAHPEECSELIKQTVNEGNYNVLCPRDDVWKED